MKLSQVREVLTGQGPPRYDAPPDIEGRPRTDRAMRITEAVARQVPPRSHRVEYNPGVAGHNPDVAMKLVVSERDVVARDENVVQLRFEAEDGAELPAWQPGSHLDFHLPSGLRRQYSLCGDPSDRTGYSVAVRRIPEGGGGSLEMHATRTRHPGDGARPPQRVSLRRRGECALRRRRNRYHADPGDGPGGARARNGLAVRLLRPVAGVDALPR